MALGGRWLTAAALVCCAIGGAAHAGTESQLSVGDVKNLNGLQTIGVVGSTEGKMMVPKFDTQGGRRILTSVQVTAALTVSGPISLMNNSAMQQSVSTVAGAGAGVAAAFNTPNPALTPKPNWVSMNKAVVNPSTSSLVTFGFKQTFDLSGQKPNEYFEGPGTVTVNLAARLLGAGQAFTTTNPLVSVVMAFPPSLWRANLELRVTYRYFAIPLPNAAAMGVVGLGVVVGARRRR